MADGAGEEDAIVLGKANDSKDHNAGYKALTGEYCPPAVEFQPF